MKKEVTFHGEFPKTPESFADFPSHVVWGEDNIRVTMLKQDSDTWYLLLKENKETTVSCSITKEDGKWKAVDVEGSQVDEIGNSFEAVWDAFQLATAYVPVIQNNEDSLPKQTLINNIKSRKFN